MNDFSDQQLLRDYAARRSEPAFAELVRRHVDFVHSAALRMVRDTHLAEDVTQGAFVALAQNAGLLTERPVLSGWLHRTAQNLAANAVRTEVRRRARETEAVAMSEIFSAEPDASWEHIAPHLDAALGELGESDRDALLLRYFERQSAGEMAQTLGISAEAAQKRVNRAVEKLRDLFAKRKITVGAGGLAVVISANAVQAAPAGLAATISAAAALVGTAVSTSTIIAATKTIVMTTLQKTILIAGLSVAVVASIFATHLKNQNDSLRQQQITLDEQIQNLTQASTVAENNRVSLQQQIEQLQKNQNELLKLRAEITRLKQPRNVLLAAMPSATNTVAQVDKTSIRVGVKFVLFPPEDLQALGIGWTTDAQGNKAGLLMEPQLKTITEAFQGASDVTIMAAPTSIASNGQESQMSVSRPAPAYGTNANLGISVSVRPFYSTNSSTFNVTLSAELKQSVGNPLQPEMQTIQITNQMNLLLGQTAVLEKEISSAGWLADITNAPAGPRSLLIFVTPTLVKASDYQRNGQRVAAIWHSPTNAFAPDPTNK